VLFSGEDLVNSAFVGDIINIIGILERQHNSIRRVSMYLKLKIKIIIIHKSIVIINISLLFKGPKLFYNDFYIRVSIINLIYFKNYIELI